MKWIRTGIEEDHKTYKQISAKCTKTFNENKKKLCNDTMDHTKNVRWMDGWRLKRVYSCFGFKNKMKFDVGNISAAAKL